MPNHCENDLFISGDESDVRECLAGIAKGDRAIDFNMILPMPSSFEGLASGSPEDCHRALFGTPWGQADCDPVPEEQLAGEYSEERRRALADYCRRSRMTPAAAEDLAIRYDNNLEAHGHTTWYGWCSENWGTKWNAYEDEGPTWETTSSGRAKAKISFSTAWAPPVPVIKALSSRWPKVGVTLKFYEGGAGFKGMLKVKGGRVVQEQEAEYRGSRGG